MKLLAYK